jgi:hypothetical protein
MEDFGTEVSWLEDYGADVEGCDFLFEAFVDAWVVIASVSSVLYM